MLRLELPGAENWLHHCCPKAPHGVAGRCPVHCNPDPSSLEAVDVPADSTLSTVLLVRPSRSRSVRLNLVVDAGVATVINSEARRRGMTRKSYVEWMVRRTAQMGG